MTSTLRRSVATVGFLVLGSLAGDARADGAWPALTTPDMGHGRYAYMHMMLQKTFLRINVATIDVRVDKATQGRLAALGRGQAYSDALAGQLTNAILGADRAVVQMQFAREVSLKRWIGVVHESLEQARSAGLLPANLEQRVKQGLPQWFAAIKDRGYEKGDRLTYSVTPKGTRTTVITPGNQVLVDRVDPDPGARLVVLSSYFAPGSDFREPLLRYLLEK